MAISTLDGVLAGMKSLQFFGKRNGVAVVAGRYFTYWASPGVPGAGTYDTTVAGVSLSSSSALVAGQIPHYDPVSGNAYLARFTATSNLVGTVLLCDRLWHNGGISATSTSPQTINSVAFPARDNNGTTNGDGVQICLEVSGLMGAGTPTITMNYTDQAGNTGHTATNMDAISSASIATSAYRMNLQAGDTGVRSIQSLTLSATMTSGTINLVAYRVLASMDITLANIQTSLDALTSGFPRIFNGTVPYIMFLPNAGGGALQLGGTYIETQG